VTPVASKEQITFWGKTLIDFQTTNFSDSLAVVELSGKLNETTRSYFFQCISDTIQGDCKQVIVDCSGLGVLGSAGLASLLMARRLAGSHGGRIYLTHVNSTLAEALEKTKLNKLFAIYPSTSSLIELIENGELAHA